MFERTTIRDARFPEYIHMGEDICLWFHFLWRYEGGAVPEVLTTVRVQKKSASQDIHKQRRAVASVVAYYLENFYTDEGLSCIAELTHYLYRLLSQPLESIDNIELGKNEELDEWVESNEENNKKKNDERSEETSEEGSKDTEYVEEENQPLHIQNNSRNYLFRFISATKRHGIIGVWKVLLRKITSR
jgi:hypothetical protein